MRQKRRRQPHALRHGRGLRYGPSAIEATIDGERTESVRPDRLSGIFGYMRLCSLGSL